MVLTKDEAMQYNSLLLQKVSTTADDKNHGKYVGNAGYANSVKYSDDNISNKRFQANGYSNYLSDLQKLVSDLKADYATLLKRSNYAKSGDAANYQYDEYYKFLQRNGYKDKTKDKCDRYTDHFTLDLLNKDTAKSLQGDYCDLQSEIQALDELITTFNIDYEYKKMSDDDNRAYLNLRREAKQRMEIKLQAFNKEFSNRADNLKANIDKFEQAISDFVTKEQSKLITKQAGLRFRRSLY